MFQTNSFASFNTVLLFHLFRVLFWLHFLRALNVDICYKIRKITVKMPQYDLSCNSRCDIGNAFKLNTTMRLPTAIKSIFIESIAHICKASVIIWHIAKKTTQHTLISIILEHPIPKGIKSCFCFVIKW